MLASPPARTDTRRSADKAAENTEDPAFAAAVTEETNAQREGESSTSRTADNRNDAPRAKEPAAGNNPQNQTDNEQSVADAQTAEGEEAQQPTSKNASAREGATSNTPTSAQDAALDAARNALASARSGEPNQVDTTGSKTEPQADAAQAKPAGPVPDTSKLDAPSPVKPSETPGDRALQARISPEATASASTPKPNDGPKEPRGTGSAEAAQLVRQVDRQSSVERAPSGIRPDQTTGAETKVISVRTVENKAERPLGGDAPKAASAPSTPAIPASEFMASQSSAHRTEKALGTAAPQQPLGHADGKNATPELDLPAPDIVKLPGTESNSGARLTSTRVTTGGEVQVVQTVFTASPATQAPVQSTPLLPGLGLEPGAGLVERTIAPQLTAAAGTRANGGIVDVMLEPPELGRVEILMELSDQGLRATLSAERQGTLDILRRHLDVLAQQFAEAGFSDVDLNFAAFAEGQAEGGEEGPTGEGIEADSKNNTGATRGASPSASRAHDGLVDLRL